MANTATAANPETTSLRVKTPPFRLSYPHLVTPYAFDNELSNGQEPSIRFVMLFPKEDKARLAGMQKAALAATVKKWGADKTKWPSGRKSPFRDGNADENLKGDGSPKDGYDGMLFTPTKRRESWLKRGHVVVRDMNNAELRDIRGNTPFGDNAIEERLYAGCWCEAIVEAFAYDVKGSKGVSFGLVAVKKLRDDEPFSSVENTNPDEYWGAANESGLSQDDRELLGDSGITESDDIPF